MYALCPLVSAGLPVAFAWQVPHLVLCKRLDVHPGVPWYGFCVAGAALGGWMYAFAGLLLFAGGFCVAGAALGAPR